MKRKTADILVAGGGIAGLIAAATFAAEGFSVICADPAPPPDKSMGTDLRSTAFLMPSVNLLAQASLWSGLAPHATALKIMRIIDAGGSENSIREIADFDATEIGQDVFGYNLPNTVIRAELAAGLERMPHATMLHSTSLTRLTPRHNSVIAALSDGTSLEARLLIAADGRNSFVRESLGIGAKRWGYAQKALVFTVRHSQPHDNVSTEIHRSGGPFTLVPLPDDKKEHHSAVVWMETGPRAAKLNSMSAAAFETELNNRSLNVLGKLSLASERAIWPIISQIADRFSGPRTALIAEAAHVVPPIGAQGLNTSLGDIAVLRTLICSARDNGRDIASHDLLEKYSRKRHSIVQTRAIGIDLLNRSSMSDVTKLKDLRLAGLKAAFGMTPVRHSLMRAGLG